MGQEDRDLMQVILTAYALLAQRIQLLTDFNCLLSHVIWPVENIKHNKTGGKTNSACSIDSFSLKLGIPLPWPRNYRFCTSTFGSSLYELKTNELSYFNYHLVPFVIGILHEKPQFRLRSTLRAAAKRGWRQTAGNLVWKFGHIYAKNFLHRYKFVILLSQIARTRNYQM